MSTPTVVADSERQPLLSKSSDDHASVTVVGEGSDSGSSTPQPVPEKKRSWWTIGWYSFLTVAGTFLLALFIKGFIDADDVDFDLRKALKRALGGGLSGAAGTFPSSLAIPLNDIYVRPIQPWSSRF
ncbi:hypothetical protein QCA50_014970 [Cerrena zonata]|uniref:Uncharacterized protein n=1 Tax=Cerrena zonata TaxID=2478898 RepID=A0AAW0FXA2_9APHY